VQGKGLGASLALLLVAAALLVGGCGGGGDSNQGTAASSTTDATEPSSPAAAQALRQGAEQIRDERSQAQQGEGPSGKAPGPPQAQSGSNEAQESPPPPAKPNNAHHDSGGGAKQFSHKGGDNSIQESGAEASATERDAAAAVLHAYLDARVAHRWDEACFYLSASAVTLLEEFADRFGKDKGIQSCPEVLEALSSGSGQSALQQSARVDVGSLRVAGDHGFLLYRGAGREAYAIPMVTEGGAWKVGAVDGTAGV